MLRTYTITTIFMLKENIQLIKASPILGTLGFIFLVPCFLVTAQILVMVFGIGIETLVNFFLYGFNGLDRNFELQLYLIISNFLMSALNFFIPIGGLALKILLVIPYSLLAFLFLMAAQRKIKM